MRGAYYARLGHAVGPGVGEPRIAHGWIHGRRIEPDDDHTLKLASARKQQAWAERHEDRAARFSTEGRMHPAGHAVVQQSQASGL
jgi:hypothetical protein